MCPFASTQTCGIVTTHFECAGAMRSCSVKFARNHKVSSSKASFEIRTNRSDKNDKQIFICRFHSHLRSSADEQRTDVESSATFIRRNKAFIEFDNLFHHLYEFVRWHFWHQNTARGALHTRCIIFNTKDSDFSIRTTKGFLPFKRFLPVVQTSCSHMDIDGF